MASLPSTFIRVAGRAVSRRQRLCYATSRVARPRGHASLSSAEAPQSHNHLFDDVPNRKNTASLKWSKYPDEVLPLWVADMDFKAPQRVIDALQERAQHGVYGYTVPPDKVVQEVVGYLARQHNWEVHPDWIVWVHGLVPALTVVARVAGLEGDDVMTNTPIYPPFLWTPKTSSLGLQQVPLVYDEARGDWKMDFERMRELVSPRTKMFLLCNPHNPVGKVFSIDELRTLANFCNEHDLLLVSDEIHCDLILDPVKTPHVPLAALRDPDIMRRSITMHAPSKTYNVPGLACAYAVIPDLELRTRFRKAAKGFVTEINCFGYEGCYAAYKYGEPWRQELLQYLRANRDLAIDFIECRIPQLRTYKKHDATYLMWLDARGLMPHLPRGSDAAGFFLEQAKVGLSDGRDFGSPWHVRLNFGCPKETLLEGLRRMEKAVAQAVKE